MLQDNTSFYFICSKNIFENTDLTKMPQFISNREQVKKQAKYGSGVHLLHQIIAKIFSAAYSYSLWNKEVIDS